LALGLILALLAASRLLCLVQVDQTASASPAAWCAWLPCPSRDCTAAATVPPNSKALEPDASLPAELLRKSPASAQRWLRMGQQLLLENQPENARDSINRSVALAPHSPPVLLEAAAFFHATGRSRQGLELMSRVLAATREYDGDIFALYRRATDVATVLRDGLPAGDLGAGRAYFLNLLEQRDFAGARLAWDWLRPLGFADRVTLRRYLLSVIEGGLHDEAASVFENFLPLDERPAGGNRIIHGGFEAESTGAPLDWVITAIPHAVARRDPACAREGSWSLRIEFDGATNLEYRHAAQQAIVSPGRWRLQAWVRTRGLTSDQGVGLRIFDARPAPDWQVWTANVSGDSDWRLLETVVTISPPARLVQVEIVRRPSRKLDNGLGGVAWIDAVSLTPAAAGQLPAAAKAGGS
jgi:hypothetical protein